MNWKIGNYVLILSTLTIAKIISVRKTGSIETLWVKNKSGEFPMSALKGSKAFNIKYGPGNSQESIVVPGFSDAENEVSETFTGIFPELGVTQVYPEVAPALGD